MAAHAGPHRPENRQVSLGKTSSPGRDGATSRGTLDRIGVASLIDVHQSFEAMSEMGPQRKNSDNRMQLEQTFGCPWIMGFVGNWTELWISKFSPCRFESIAPPLLTSASKSLNSAALPTTMHPRCLRRNGISFPAGLKSKTRYDRNEVFLH